MEDEINYDESQRSVFNGLQLAYKVVANSVYGQAGSRTSPIRKTCVAACTTAAGRNALYTAKRIVESEFGADVIYGDTDSIFIKFPTQDLATSIKLGLEAGKSITRQIGRHPYKIAYEKTLFPFILFCRKRYVGMKYEEDPNPAKAKQMSMGVVLKRRDNAPIVKDVFGGALKILMSGGGIKKAQAFVNDILLKVFDNKLPLEKFIVSKSLRDDYAAMAEGYEGRATLPAHRVLADRMAARDPGTAPKVGDRLQYVYVAENKHKSSQGDRIEHVDYVKTHKLTPDTQFYITNQIQNPVAQLFALCIEQLDGYVAPKKPTFSDLKATYLAKFAEDEHPEEQATIAVLKKKEAYLDSLMFLGSPALSRKVKAAIRGPMDAFIRK
jgi:DNA polymerase delta subunit 1